MKKKRNCKMLLIRLFDATLRYYIKKERNVLTVKLILLFF
jgi:hypothetical protein